MSETLSPKEIEHLLNAQTIGRIGCYAEGKIYVVPVNYVYHDGYIYAHAKEGLNMHLLRASASICFEVDQLEGDDRWKSVILWGSFEELRYPVRGAEGIKRLEERLHPVESSPGPAYRPAGSTSSRQQLVADRKPIAFRIKITESSGRYETPPRAEQAT